MDGGFGNIHEMISKITQNPDAMAMLSSILGSGSNNGEEPKNMDPEQSHESHGDAAPASLSLPLSTRSHGRRRREILYALRPYLGSRRAASLDRMIRALELYEIIEETHLLKGGS